MPESSHAPLNFPGSVVLRWMFKGFLLGLLVGVAAGYYLLAGS